VSGNSVLSPVRGERGCADHGVGLKWARRRFSERARGPGVHKVEGSLFRAGNGRSTKESAPPLAPGSYTARLVVGWVRQSCTLQVPAGGPVAPTFRHACASRSRTGRYTGERACQRLEPGAQIRQAGPGSSFQDEAAPPCRPASSAGDILQGCSVVRTSGEVCSKIACLSECRVSWFSS
jgi:hypothetical protein